jgi:hypothetical protein
LNILHQLIDIKSVLRNMGKKRKDLFHRKGRQVRGEESQETKGSSKKKDFPRQQIAIPHSRCDLQRESLGEDGQVPI